MASLETNDDAVIDDLVILALAIADERELHIVGAYLAAALEALRAQSSRDGC